jgi:uncharacterized membrane protein YfcA
MLATGMLTLNAVASSLVAVTSSTAANYVSSGLVHWPLVGLFVTGGLVGSLLGARSATSLAARKGAQNSMLAIVIFAIAGYILIRSFGIL